MTTEPRTARGQETKRRILEVYLYVAEFGEGVFGVEASARHHFGVGASDLSDVQAVRLAAILPAPADQLLRCLVDRPGLTVPELAAATNRKPTGGSWHTAMRHLKSNDLVQEVDGHLSASAWLFD